MGEFSLTDFMRESLRIEGIHREPTGAEMSATEAFLALDAVTVEDMCRLVAVYAPGHILRAKRGHDVRVGSYVAPPGGPAITRELADLLETIGLNRHPRFAWEGHHEYEMLHPFTDGNGRSGRTLWLWQVGGHAPLGFLHHWYYASLENSPVRRSRTSHDERA